MLEMDYNQYCYSKYFDNNRMLIATTNGYTRIIKTKHLCSEIDDNPELAETTFVAF